MQMFTTKTSLGHHHGRPLELNETNADTSSCCIGNILPWKVATENAIYNKHAIHSGFGVAMSDHIPNGQVSGGRGFYHPACNWHQNFHVLLGAYHIIHLIKKQALVGDFNTSWKHWTTWDGSLSMENIGNNQPGNQSFIGFLATAQVACDSCRRISCPYRKSRCWARLVHNDYQLQSLSARTMVSASYEILRPLRTLVQSWAIC